MHAACRRRCAALCALRYGTCPSAAAQINEALADQATPKLDYSLRQELDQALGVGRRLAGAMVRFFGHEGRASGVGALCGRCVGAWVPAPCTCACHASAACSQRACRLPAEAFNSLLLRKNLAQRVWTDGVEARQVPGVGPLLAGRLAEAGLTKLAQLAGADPRRLETICQRNYPFGKQRSSHSGWAVLGGRVGQLCTRARLGPPQK